MSPLGLIVLVLLFSHALLRAAVAWMNLSALSPVAPVDLAGIFDAERYRRSQQYLRDTTRLQQVQSVFSLLVMALLILTGGFDALDRFTRAAGLGPISTGVLFIGLLAGGAALIGLPFEIVDTFRIEQRYGFNRTTARTFVLDHLKGWALAILLGAPLIALVLGFFLKTGAAAWLWAWAAVTGWELILALVAPGLILPLFNRFTPLPEGPLRTRIEAYLVAQRLPFRGVYTMDGSRRSGKSNAFFTGFGRFRRFVLLDTLVARHTTDELIAVMAHEVGHFALRHIPRLMAASIATAGLLFFALGLVIHHPAVSMGLSIRTPSLHANLLVFGVLYTPLAVLISLGIHALSRRFEYAADAYAVRTCGNPAALDQALRKLAGDNLANLTPHPVKVLLDYSHPPLGERLKAVAALAPPAG
jgi:STE24 endopeptidase